METLPPNVIFDSTPPNDKQYTSTIIDHMSQNHSNTSCENVSLNKEDSSIKDTSVINNNTLNSKLDNNDD